MTSLIQQKFCFVFYQKNANMLSEFNQYKSIVLLREVEDALPYKLVLL